MSHTLSVTLNVEHPPRVSLVNGRNPEIEFADPHYSMVCSVAFYTHPDPAAYLRDLASLCIGLAEQVDALPQEVSA
jgi:hypothetical protein